MRYTTLKTFALVGLLFTLAAVSVHAQSRTRVEANIPFDFAVGNARLKAGHYIVDFADTEKLFVTSVDGKIKVFALAPGILERMRNDPSSRLVFHRYGNLYFLSEVWISESGNGLYPSKAERRLAKELAKTRAKPETAKILSCPATGVSSTRLSQRGEHFSEPARPKSRRPSASTAPVRHCAAVVPRSGPNDRGQTRNN